MTSSFVSIGYDLPHLFDLHVSLFTDSKTLALSLSRSILTSQTLFTILHLSFTFHSHFTNPLLSLHKPSSLSSISFTFHPHPQTLFSILQFFHIPSSPTNSLHYPLSIPSQPSFTAIPLPPKSQKLPSKSSVPLKNETPKANLFQSPLPSPGPIQYLSIFFFTTGAGM